MTVELTVTATRSVDGKAGFKVPIVEVALGVGGSRHRADGDGGVRGPVDRDGKPVKVARASSELKG
jgi:hypothetical protein